MSGKRVFYTCCTEYNYHVGNDADGAKFYNTLKELKKNIKCWKECGIYEVTMTSKLKNPGKYTWVDAKSARKTRSARNARSKI